jgi:hypothetical protein
MKKIKWLNLIPFFIIGVVLIATWYIFLTSEIDGNYKHYVALSAFIFNVFLYVFRFKWGVLFTGILLVAASFNLISFFAETRTHSYFMKWGDTEIVLPAIQGYPILLLILFLLLNHRFLKDEFGNPKKEINSPL